MASYSPKEGFVQGKQDLNGSTPPCHCRSCRRGCRACSYIRSISGGCFMVVTDDRCEESGTLLGEWYSVIVEPSCISSLEKWPYFVQTSCGMVLRQRMLYPDAPPRSQSFIQSSHSSAILDRLSVVTIVVPIACRYSSLFPPGHPRLVDGATETPVVDNGLIMPPSGTHSVTFASFYLLEP